MENKTAKQISKMQQSHKSIRIAQTTEKKLAKALLTANKKKFGRKIKADQVLNLALEILTDDHIRLLQEQSLTNEDRKEQLRQSYILEVGPISKDQFTGFMMTGEFQKFIATHRTAQIVAPTASEARAS
jgi:hypothetical protein